MLPPQSPTPGDSANPPSRDTSGRFARGAGARRPRRTPVQVISDQPQAGPAGARIVGRRPLIIRRP
jgi:hypothetical protein